MITRCNEIEVHWAVFWTFNVNDVESTVKWLFAAGTFDAHNNRSGRLLMYVSRILI